MKKIQIMGWLVMAAAFITTFTACSSDDNIDESKAPVRTVSVTVGAGIIDDAITRSGIIEGKNDQDKTTRTLKFTTGDKLFVRAMYGTEHDGYYPKMLRGFLTMDNSSLSEDGKSASFSGTLVQYNGDDNNTYTASGSIDESLISDDPIGNAAKAFATLVHKDATLNTDYTDDGWDINYAFDKLAPNVNTLMTKNLAVTGSYVDNKKIFRLDLGTFDPILNCTINELTKDATYTVTYTYGDDPMPISPDVTADGNGTAKFAFFGTAEGEEKHIITLVNTNNASDTKTFDLGEKDLLMKKIYNITRTATAN